MPYDKSVISELDSFLPLQSPVIWFLKVENSSQMGCKSCISFSNNVLKGYYVFFYLLQKHVFILELLESKGEMKVKALVGKH